jgi:hypothetical protein
VTLFCLAAALPVLFWAEANTTAPLLRQAGVTEIAVPPTSADAWKHADGIKVDVVDLDKTVKLPAPSVNYRMNQASASRVPWVNSNGWRFMRQPTATFSYDVKGNAAGLATAEAFAFGSAAVLQTDEAGLAPLAAMLKFLRSLDAGQGPALADIGFVDDGSSLDAEVMNLLVRENLLFRIVRAPEPDLKLTVQLGSKQYLSKNPPEVAHQIRANLGDDRRFIRIYGSSVVIARVTGQAGKLRLHLLNYGAGRGTIIGSFRVRLLGHYKTELHSFDVPEDHVVDYSSDSNATEFTVPELKTYAVIYLTTTQP